MTVALLGKRGLGPWLGKNRNAGIRYSSTPDVDWQPFGDPLSDARLQAIRERSGKQERATHYYDADLFPGMTRDQIPSDASFAIAAGKIRKIIDANRNDLIRRGARPGDFDSVAKWGTGPWRVQQLHELAARALADGRQHEALLYLSAMGHVVADLANPHHATVSYDGQNLGPAGRGIHTAFEMKMIEEHVRAKGVKGDPVTDVWPSTHVTNRNVERFASEIKRTEIPPGKLVDAMVDLAASGGAYLVPLGHAFIDAREAAAKFGEKSEWDVWNRFGKRYIQVGNLQMSVLEAAERRMAAASVAVARTFDSALARAREINPDLKLPTEQFEYDQAFAIEKYPAPDYIPKEAPSVAGQHREAQRASRRCGGYRRIGGH